MAAICGEEIKLKRDRKLDEFRPCRHASRQSTSMPNDAYMYSLYCRIGRLKPHAVDVDRAVQRAKQVPDRPVAKFLNDGHTNCKCYADSMNAIQGMDKRNSPLRLPAVSLKPIWINYEKNQHAQLPLATILVQWQLQRRFTAYTKRELHNILSCYGHIAAIYMHSFNSAIVVFGDIQSACRALESTQLGYNMTCSWWNNHMLTHSIYNTRNISDSQRLTFKRLNICQEELKYNTTILY